LSTALAIAAIVPPSPALRARLIERRWASTLACLDLANWCRYAGTLRKKLSDFAVALRNVVD
jgi:hypothetical protein